MANKVYVIHFEEKLKHSQHYVGFTKLPIEERMDEHRKGTGARIMAVLKERGIPWVLAKVFDGKSRKFERALKNTNNTKSYCPICMGKDVDYNPKGGVQ